jgi:TetR/AcrR family transcriptional repressor of bet genes
MQPIRRDQLIRATVATINRIGLADTTIAQVANTAGLSAGIVSHYFGDKGGLINATMRQLLRELWQTIAERRQAAADDSPKAQLQAIIDGNFDESQISPIAIRVWLTFWAASMHQPDLSRLQNISNRRLYSNICAQFRRALPTERAHFATLGLTAMLDGLWLHGSLDIGSLQFNTERARAIAYDYLDDQLSHV